MDKLKILFQNVRSLKTVNKEHNELLNLKTLLLSEKPDLLILVETWLDKNVLDSEFL